MPEKLIIEEEATIVEDAASAAGFKVAPPLTAVRAGKTEVNALNDGTPNWGGTCAICLDLLLVEAAGRTFYKSTAASIRRRSADVGALRVIVPCRSGSMKHYRVDAARAVGAAAAQPSETVPNAPRVNPPLCAERAPHAGRCTSRRCLYPICIAIDAARAAPVARARARVEGVLVSKQIPSVLLRALKL
eukprot:CAMPEP_0184248824 /NCGR_PEP_ID=MMETSP0977-20130417/3441_1 /TAXON_ID=483370 /ORGANISM="non described non described, Strain CCMP2097" /LENGTH=188 /DNA_ID=CAMNT_0026554193 /DNA_START=24 /DNA_END=586 /DNA_ORIENTATION=+